MKRRPPRSTLIPYATLYRSDGGGHDCDRLHRPFGTIRSPMALGHGRVLIIPSRSVDAIVAEGATSAADRKSTRLNSSHAYISYAVFCLKKTNFNQILKQNAK